MLLTRDCLHQHIFGVMYLNFLPHFCCCWKELQLHLPLKIILYTPSFVRFFLYTSHDFNQYISMYQNNEFLSKIKINKPYVYNKIGKDIIGI